VGVFNDQYDVTQLFLRYLRAAEQRLYEVEAVIGILLSVPDPRLQDVISSVNKDPFGKMILDRVNDGAFGPGGRGLGPSDANRDIGEGGGVGVMGRGIADSTGIESGARAGVRADIGPLIINTGICTLSLRVRPSKG
jgi:hypothetical protein